MSTPHADKRLESEPYRLRVQAANLLKGLPRLEIALLAMAFLGNFLAKVQVLSRGHTPDLVRSLPNLLPSDLAFFLAAAAVMALLHAALPSPISTRSAILLGVVLCAWSAANWAWLTVTGVQIHVGVFSNLVKAPDEFGPIVTNRLIHTPRSSIPLLAACTIVAGVVLWRLIRPQPLDSPRRTYLIRSLATGGAALAALMISLVSSGSVSRRPRLAALAYSGHGFAVTSLLGQDGTSIPDHFPEDRRIPRRWERQMAPLGEKSPRPHVVLVVLESTAWWATSMGGQRPEQTPTLTQLAGEGILFTHARTAVTHTTQSQFTLLTGITSNLEGDFVEAVLVEPPYESLATVLSASGYRSRFCQMVRATYECNPGLVANLGFDSFWAREDLGDPSTHLGYLAGDDFKMIAPAFEWLDQQQGPCLLLFMTSVAHHPYEVPQWYGPRVEDHQEAYLQAIRYTDAFVKQVVDELRSRDLAAQTLLCVIADHGEGFGRHDIYLHNENPYDEALRIPWILTWPGRIKPAGVNHESCSMIDVTPTILSLLGFDISKAGFEGVDALAPAGGPRRLPFAGWSPTFPAGIVAGDQKVIYWPSLDEAYRYDLSSAPDEAAPFKLPEMEKTQVRQELTSWRLRSRISFAHKRYRQRFLYHRWQTSCLGNTAWCYYVSPSEGRTP